MELSGRPYKMAPCLGENTDAASDYYGKNVTWVVSDTQLVAKVHLSVGMMRNRGLL